MARNKKGGLSFYYKEKRITNEKLLNAFGYVFWAFLAVLLAFVIVYFWGIKTSMVGNSMEPVLYNGQELLIDRLSYNFLKPKRGDVVVFYPNGNSNSHYYVKRVIGIPGDTVRIENGMLYLNGVPQPFLFADKIDDAGVAYEEILVAEDEYFVMGDNCNNSEDSRSANLGMVKKENIYGKAWLHMAAEASGIGTIEKTEFEVN